MIEQKIGRVHEARQEPPSDCEHAVAFAPDDSNITAKDVGDRVEYQIESLRFKAGKIGHVTLNEFNVQSVSRRDQFVFRKLFP